MTLRRALIPGCALALLALDGRAQETAPTQTPPAQEQPAAQAPVAPQGRTLKGRVLDRVSGEGLALVRVIIKGTTRGVETEPDGTFSLPGVPQGEVTLDVSSQDHLRQNVKVAAGQGELTILMQPSFMEEMVVVGRASELARKHMANSVASVSNEELNRTPVQTVDQALQGKIAGANIQSNSGAPGGGLQMRLRGVSTVIGRAEPLYVIDGVLVSDSAVVSGMHAVTKSPGGSNPDPNQDNQVNRIADINPNDIESIEVLKGASAAAIYGSKAANGVIIINTKRGRAGAGPQVNVTQRLGTYMLANKIGSRTFGSLEEAQEAWGPAAAQYWQPGVTYDHEQALAGRTDLSYETVASVSGAAGDTRYFFSAMAKDDAGIIQNTGYEKQSMRLNLSQKLGKSVEVNVSSNLLRTLGARGLTNNDNAGITNHMVLPFTPNFFNASPGPDGTYPKNPFIGSEANPLQTVALTRNDEEVWRIIGGGDVVWTPWSTEANNLKVLANVGVDRFQQENKLFFPPELNFQQADGGLRGQSLFGTTQVRQLNAGLNLVHTYQAPNGGMKANTSAGLQFEERTRNTVNLVSSRLAAGQENLDYGSQVDVGQYREEERDRGYYVQEELLLLDERLTVVGALRAEQSSNNGNPKALFFFPKLATAYRLPAFHPSINEFKVRAAYGETGNLPRYGQKFTPLRANTNLEGNAGLIGTGIAGDPNIRPERQREVELGLDAMLLGGDLVAELTVYQRNISDLLLRRTMPPSSGFTTQFLNGGGLRNRGIEAMLQVTPVRGELVEWKSAATFALNRSMVTDLPVPADSSGRKRYRAGGFGASLGMFQLEEGRSATQIVGNLGLNEDGTCCVVQVLGDTEPTFRMSFTNTVNVGPVSLSLLADWQQGSQVINLTRFIYDLAGNSPDYVGAGEQRLQDWRTNAGTYVEDATFLKVRELTVSWQLPASFVSRLPQAKSARLSFSGRNLLMFTNYSGLDPEVSNFGNQPIARNIDVAPFPPSRSFWTSLDVGF